MTDGHVPRDRQSFLCSESILCSYGSLTRSNSKNTESEKERKLERQPDKQADRR